MKIVLKGFSLLFLLSAIFIRGSAVAPLQIVSDVYPGNNCVVQGRMMDLPHYYLRTLIERSTLADEPKYQAMLKKGLFFTRVAPVDIYELFLYEYEGNAEVTRKKLEKDRDKVIVDVYVCPDFMGFIHSKIIFTYETVTGPLRTYPRNS